MPKELPRPTAEMGISLSEWNHFAHKWKRYKRTSLAGMNEQIVVDHLWAICSDELEESLWKQGSEAVTT